MKKNKKQRINNGHWLEATDRVAVTQNNIEDNLRSHPAIASKKKYIKLVDKAQEVLAELYQQLGQKL